MEAVCTKKAEERKRQQHNQTRGENCGGGKCGDGGKN